MLQAKAINGKLDILGKATAFCLSTCYAIINRQAICINPKSNASSTVPASEALCDDDAVNNAGITDLGPTESFLLEQHQQIIKINLEAVLALTAVSLLNGHMHHFIKHSLLMLDPCKRTAHNTFGIVL